MKIITEKFSLAYIFVNICVWLITAIILCFYDSIQTSGYTEGIVTAFLGIILSTLCFLIGPLAVCSIGMILYLGSILSLPYWFCALIGYYHGEINIINQYGMCVSFFSCLVLSIFGYFNWVVLIKSKIYGV